MNFVRNGVAKVQNCIPSNYLNFELTVVNLTAFVSRTMQAKKLVQHCFWWSGPHWFHKNLDEGLSVEPTEEHPPARKLKIKLMQTKKFVVTEENTSNIELSRPTSSLG